MLKGDQIEADTTSPRGAGEKKNNSIEKKHELSN